MALGQARDVQPFTVPSFSDALEPEVLSSLAPVALKLLTEGHTLFLVCFHHAGLDVDLLGVSLLYFVAANPAMNLAACSSCAVKPQDIMYLSTNWKFLA